MHKLFCSAIFSRQFFPGTLVLAWLAALCVAVGAVGQPAGAAGLAPHTAYYKMKLMSARSGSNIEAAVGDIVVKWERDCTGWTMTNRTIFRIGYSGGESTSFTIDAATWESAPGDRYTFLVRTEYDGKEVERVEGSARIDATGRYADFVKPSEKRIALPPDTVFPMRHTALVVAAARTNSTFLRATVFDGFTEGGSQFVNAIVGKKQSVRPPVSAKFPSLGGLPAWIVSLAFFPDDPAAAEPDSEISLNLVENGIAAWMDMDFGDFRVRGDLEKLQVHVPASCK